MPAFGHAMLAEWMLDPEMLYLNHGTVGATPRRVLAAQQAIRDEIERQPSRFLLRELADFEYMGQPPSRPRARLREAADDIGAFLGVRGDDLAFVENITVGANAVLSSFDFRPGDEVLVTDHGYGGVVNAATHWTRRAGASVRVAELPHPRLEPDGVIAAIMAATGPKTRLAIIDHVTSGSGTILPIAELASRLHAAGVAVLVDGAHAPGAIALDLPSLAVEWYSGNLHKWAMAPRSCGVLWASPARQVGLRGPVVSWGLDHGMSAEFDWTGTRDVSIPLAAPAGVAFMRSLGLDAMRAWQHGLAWDSAQRLSKRWDSPLHAAESQVGCMVTIGLPERAGSTPEAAWDLRTALLDQDHIEIQLHSWRKRLWIRISAQVYNEPADVERLADAIDRRIGS
jgi:isopenicillin-N epimerase